MTTRGTCGHEHCCCLFTTSKLVKPPSEYPGHNPPPFLRTNCKDCGRWLRDKF